MINDEERGNEDLLQFYFQEKIPVHIFLKRILSDGKNCWLNGTLVRKATDRVWILNERVLGEVRVSLAEISPSGVSQYKEGEDNPKSFESYKKSSSKGEGILPEEWKFYEDTFREKIKK